MNRGVDTVKFELLARDMSKGGQSAHLVDLVALTIAKGSSRAHHRLRVRIKSDAYKGQSSAVVERWDEGAWQEVWRLTPAAMATAEGLCYVRALGIEAFELDRTLLLDRAAAVLSGE